MKYEPIIINAPLQLTEGLCIYTQVNYSLYLKRGHSFSAYSIGQNNVHGRMLLRHRDINDVCIDADSYSENLIGTKINS